MQHSRRGRAARLSPGPSRPFLQGWPLELLHAVLQQKPFLKEVFRELGVKCGSSLAPCPALSSGCESGSRGREPGHAVMLRGEIWAPQPPVTCEWCLEVAFIGGNAPTEWHFWALLYSWESLQSGGSRKNTPTLSSAYIPSLCVWEHSALSGMLKIAHVPLHQLTSIIWCPRGHTEPLGLPSPWLTSAATLHVTDLERKRKRFKPLTHFQGPGCEKPALGCSAWDQLEILREAGS